MAGTDAVVEHILDAHGGSAYWDTLTGIEVDMSARGFLFTAKGIAPLRHHRLTVSTRGPEAVMWDYPQPGQRAVLQGEQRVQILDGSGAVVQDRPNPRAAFGHWRRQLRWDVMDFAYFSGYAMWNYLNLPFLLRADGMRVELQPARPDGLTRLRVTFPPELPTHSPTQELVFDAGGRLLRHDYTAEVVGGWAKAAHLCSDYRQFGGLWMPTTRRVYPTAFGGRPLPGPTLVAIDIHGARPVAEDH